MDLNFARPNKTLSILDELKKTKNILNCFKKEEGIENFLKKNKNKYNIKSKIDLIISNFEENNIFLYSNKNTKNIFNFLSKSKIKYELEEALIYKLYFYFYGYIPEEELKEMLFQYSNNKLKNLDLKKFIEENKKELIRGKCNFPKKLNGEYLFLKEIAELIDKEEVVLKDIDGWEENIFKYISSTKIRNMLIEKIMKRLNKKICLFFQINKKVEIKDIIIDYKHYKESYYKIIKVKLQKQDNLVFIRNLNLNTERNIYYLEKNFNDILEIEKNKKVILNEYDLIKVLKKNYSLNKIYLLKEMLKKLFNKNS